MYDTRLDPEEQALLESVENGEWQPVAAMHEEIQRYQTYAAAQTEEEAVTIVLPQRDLSLLQAKAEAAGVSYQTLIVRLVQRFVAS